MSNYYNLLDMYQQETCIILKDATIIYTSTKRGVAPLIDFYEQNGIQEHLIVIDRIVGKAAALLAVLIGAKTISTPIISRDAYQFLLQYDIDVQYIQIVDYIINRDHTGRCPIESSVLTINNPEEGYTKIKHTLQTL